MTKINVSWEIDFDDDDFEPDIVGYRIAKQAAEKALETLRDPDTTATIFTVERYNVKWHVDLTLDTVRFKDAE